jgi:hypothetical protein
MGCAWEAVGAGDVRDGVGPVAVALARKPDGVEVLAHSLSGYSSMLAPRIRRPDARKSV